MDELLLWFIECAQHVDLAGLSLVNCVAVLKYLDEHSLSHRGNKVRVIALSCTYDTRGEVNA